MKATHDLDANVFLYRNNGDKIKHNYEESIEIVSALIDALGGFLPESFDGDGIIEQLDNAKLRWKHSGGDFLLWELIGGSLQIQTILVRGIFSPARNGY